MCFGKKRNHWIEGLFFLLEAYFGGEIQFEISEKRFKILRDKAKKANEKEQPVLKFSIRDKWLRKTLLMRIQMIVL